MSFKTDHKPCITLQRVKLSFCPYARLETDKRKSTIFIILLMIQIPQKQNLHFVYLKIFTKSLSPITTIRMRCAYVRLIQAPALTMTGCIDPPGSAP